MNRNRVLEGLPVFCTRGGLCSQTPCPTLSHRVPGTTLLVFSLVSDLNSSCRSQGCSAPVLAEGEKGLGELSCPPPPTL